MRYIIWDFNGTIIDDTQLCLDVENYMLEERGMKHGFTKEWYKDNFCFPVYEYYFKLGYTFETETYDDIAYEFNILYNKRFHECGLNEGFEEKINESIGKGYKNVILSASHQDNLIRQCKELNIDKYFEELIGIDDILAGSKIDRAKTWMQGNDIDVENCILLGDSTHDGDVAKELDIDNYVLIANGHQSYNVLKEDSDNVVHTLFEVEI